MTYLDEMPVRRCAIYTRKSSNNLLDQQMNSLEAQRDICSAYVRSQQHKRWIELPKRYDDGGFSGADTQRPALSELMRDIEAGLVDAVIIYKIDRLTRSLLDFVRLMEVFDRYNIPFVSISQSFDTSESLGRMILNILLTFSQFEREMITERIRDNVRTRKRFGRWTGGPPPFGYELMEGALHIVEEEAAIVRFIYSQFLELGTYEAVQKPVLAAGLRSSLKVSKGGKVRARRQIGSGLIYRILNNPIYLGVIVCEEEFYQGQHEAIVSREVWDAARALCAKRKKEVAEIVGPEHLLSGFLRDSLGRKMIPAIDKCRGALYYYYISSNANWSNKEGRKQFRANARKLDKLVVAALCRFLEDRVEVRNAMQTAGICEPELSKLATAGSCSASLLERSHVPELRHILTALCEVVEAGCGHVSITLRTMELRRFLDWSGKSPFHGRPSDWSWSGARYKLGIPVQAVSVGRSSIVPILPRNAPSDTRPSPHLVELLARARAAQNLYEINRDQPIGELARKMGCSSTQFSRLVRLNYLAPDIVTAILDGTQPRAMTSRSLLQVELPLDWALQRKMLGIVDQGRITSAGTVVKSDGIWTRR